MGVKNVIKKGARAGFNPMRWVGFDQLTDNAKTIRGMADSLFDNSKKKTARTETFEQAIQRLGLSEADIAKRIKNAKLFVMVCLIASVFLLGYTIYLFTQALVLGGFVALILTCLLWAYAFREHFNYFQMKQRRLGCTFKEWFSTTFTGKGSRS